MQALNRGFQNTDGNDSSCAALGEESFLSPLEANLGQNLRVIEMVHFLPFLNASYYSCLATRLPTSLAQALPRPSRDKNIRDKSLTPRHCSLVQILTPLPPYLVGVQSSPIPLFVTPYWFHMDRGHSWGATEAVGLRLAFQDCEPDSQVVLQKLPCPSWARCSQSP